MSESASARDEMVAPRFRDRVLRFLGRIGQGIELASFETSGLPPDAAEEITSYWGQQEKPQALDSPYSTESLVRAGVSEVKIP